jgi:hypothetical protein
LRTRRLNGRLAFVVRTYSLIFPLVFAIGFAVQWQRTDADRDTAVFFRAATNPQAGHSIYHPLPEPGVFRSDPTYIYPPPLAAALRPLGPLGYLGFARAWLVLLSSAYWVFAAVVARIAVGRYEFGPTLIAGSLLFFVPGTIPAWNMGNADLIVWSLVALAFAHAGRARGAALAASTLIKLTTLWVWLFAIRDRRTVIGSAAAIVVAGVVCLISLGPAASVRESLTYLGAVFPSLSQGEFWTGTVQRWSLAGIELPIRAPGNLSLSMALVSLTESLGLWSYDGGSLPAVLRAWMLLAGTGIPILVAALTRKWSVEDSMGVVLLASLLFAPILRINYLPMLVPVAVLRWKQIPGRRPIFHALRRRAGRKGPEPLTRPAGELTETAARSPKA